MRALYIMVLALFLCIDGYSQKKKKGTSFIVSTSFNFHEKPDSYLLSREYVREFEDAELTFETPVSGTFIIEEGLNKYKVENIRQLPHQSFSFGFAFQKINKNNYFHELHFTKSSFMKSNYTDKYIVTDTLGNKAMASYGFVNKNASIGMRYEFGKYMMTSDQKIRAGISTGLIVNFFHENHIPNSPSSFGIRGSSLSLGFSLIPSAQIKITEHVSIEAKAVPILFWGEIGAIRFQNPNIFPTHQRINNKSFEPSFKWSGAIMLKYTVRAPNSMDRKRR